MLVDTHAHIYADRFHADLSEVLDRARASGVAAVVMPAIDVASIEAALELAERHETPDLALYVMAALHPTETKGATDADFDRVTALCAHERVVAIGESGLDYYWDRTFDERQQAFLRRHVRLAIDRDLPLILHARDKQGRDEVFVDLVRILREERDASARPERCRGIFHCFGGPSWVAEASQELGFLVGIGGTLTFKNGGVEAALAGVPLERIVLETDAPYLAPTPHRGRRNEPAYVRLVAERLAAVKGVPVEEVERVTTANAVELFRLPPLGVPA